MPKQQETPASVLKSLMEEYQLNPFSLAKEIKLSPSLVRQITIGESKISVQTALRLGKFFGTDPVVWLSLQLEADMRESLNDKELMAVIKGIPKAQKPSAKSRAQAKPAKKAASSDKRKKPAKAPRGRGK